MKNTWQASGNAMSPSVRNERNLISGIVSVITGELVRCYNTPYG
jgi:hypothetical protein